MPATLTIEVAYAGPAGQFLVAIEVPAGTTAVEAVALSGLLERCPELDLTRNDLGVFGRAVRPGRVLEAGERVEIYRALRADPKDARRRRAAAGGVTGRRRGGA